MPSCDEPIAGGTPVAEPPQQPPSEDYDGWPLIPASAKTRTKTLPFLTFPITKACNFRCDYCGEGGELSASMVDRWDAGDLLSKARLAVAHGVTKIRLTGGEPFMHRNIAEIMLGLQELGVYVHVNTNGYMLPRRRSLLRQLSRNFHFAVSLDTTDEARFHAITQTKDTFRATVRGIELVAEMGLLMRLNMVVTQANVSDVPAIISYCRQLGCDLKLLDVVSVPLPFGSRQALHVCLTDVEERLAAEADAVEFHEYARSFGTPCRIYSVGGVQVTVKNTWHGSRYDAGGICDECPYFPCHEGLYDIFSLPDGRVVGCRWSESSVAATNESGDRYAREGDYIQALERMADVFRRADHVARESNPAMRPQPEFVRESLERQRAERARRRTAVLARRGADRAVK
jgi:molybdenum cofactor biosynthesis enzyme MoaA